MAEILRRFAPQDDSRDGAARDGKGWSVITAAGRMPAHLRLGNGERRAGMPALHTTTATAKAKAEATTAKAKA
ncbi:MAG: hypothetical protein ABFE07_26410 [Armatimonadia bacterium]